MAKTLFECKDPLIRLRAARDADELQNLSQFFAMATMTERRIDAINEWRHLWDAIRPKSKDRSFCPEILEDRGTYQAVETRFSGVLGVIPDICKAPRNVEKITATVRGLAYGLVIEPEIGAEAVATGIHETFDATRPRGKTFYRALADLTFPEPDHSSGEEYASHNPLTEEHMLDLDLAWPREGYLQIAREI